MDKDSEAICGKTEFSKLTLDNGQWFRVLGARTLRNHCRSPIFWTGSPVWSSWRGPAEETQICFTFSGLSVGLFQH